MLTCERQPDRWLVELRRADRGGYLRGRPWPDGVALGATVIVPDGALDGRDIEVTLVAKRDVDAAMQVRWQQIEACLARHRGTGR